VEFSIICGAALTVAFGFTKVLIPRRRTMHNIFHMEATSISTTTTASSNHQDEYRN
jgi:hypothetical protein